MALGGLQAEGDPRPTPSGEWEYTFRCENASEMREGDQVLLSDGDPIRGEAVTGSILRLSERGVTVWTPERIAHPALLDRYSSDIVHDRTLRNLWRWLRADPRLRDLVAGRRAPAFAAEPPPADLPGDLNTEQRVAVTRALAAKDFLLIQGPPGTGKTRVVAEIARLAMARGERVLLAAFTNQAVDNVLMRLASDGHHAFVRLGHALSVNPSLHPYRLAEQAARHATTAAAAAANVPSSDARPLFPADAHVAPASNPDAPTPASYASALSRDAALVNRGAHALTPFPVSLGQGASAADRGTSDRDSDLAASNSGLGALDPDLTSPDPNRAAPDPDALRQALLGASLVATTTATWSAERYDEAGEPLTFDLALIDEASQLTIPALLGALRFAKRFVLVGDERQLPPLVVSREAAESGLGRSLFVALGERWGAAATVSLRAQYRMHPAICGFPSAEFYGGALEAAGPARTAQLDLAFDPLDPLRPLLDPARPMLFIDLPDGERAGKVSHAQADVVRRLALALRARGIPADEIGVVAPYRAQVAAIRQRLAAGGEPDIAVDTVDRFQGAERRVMFLSFGGRITDPSQTPNGRGAGFLADPHRLNVALTRAQRKLILVGDRPWLETMPLLQRLIAHCAGLYGGKGGIVRATIQDR
jgi:hypothetical protein